MSALIETSIKKDAVHVLIVGVAGYDSAPGHVPPKPLPGLVKSVERAARFWCNVGPLLQGRTIGSVEVLLSPGSQPTELTDKNGDPVQPATFANVRSAFDAWVGRCKTSPDSLAIMHWLGHGAAELARTRENNYAITLYCQDVAVADTPVQLGVSLSETIHSLKSLPFAPNALCFIDACRSTPCGDNQREYESAISIPPKIDRTKNIITCFSLTFPGSETYCSPTEIPDCGFRGGSVITEAILDALEHFAWNEVGGNYPVYAAGIREAVNFRLRWWGPYLGLPHDVEINASAQKDLMVSVLRLPKSMIELIVSPIAVVPSAVDLISSDRHKCLHHDGYLPPEAGIPMVVLQPKSFRAEVPVGGWCAVPSPAHEAAARHFHVHAFEQYFRDKNWRP